MGAVEIYPGIFQIRLPVPGRSPGPVNVYYFVGKNRTLVDTGMPFAVRELKTALNSLGNDFCDITHILFTHNHIDHYGAAPSILTRSRNPITLMAHYEDCARIEGGSDFSIETFNRFLKRMAVPFGLRLMTCYALCLSALIPLNCFIDKKLYDGDRLTLGNYRAKIIGVPGHTKGSICIYLETEKILFAGDHILPHITPNALPMFDRKQVLPRRSSQTEFYRSIDRIEALAPAMIFPAHGPRIDNPAAVFRMYRDCFSERQRKILSIVKRDTSTIHRISRLLFADLYQTWSVLDRILAISEVYTHLQVLEMEGRIDLRQYDNIVYAHPRGT